jgi:NADH dehydrogenase FAD-containing subunit
MRPRSAPEAASVPRLSDSARPRLLILGCGFGGFSLAARLSPRDFDVTLVAPRNHFVFTPLLPSAVTGTVEFRSIAEPARRRLPGVRVVEAAAEEIDWDARSARCRAVVHGERFSIPFDILVCAVGVAVADYGIPGVREHGLPLQSIEDARTIRRRILEAFAAAEIPSLDEATRRRRVTFVVCGGGPTGVEVAAEIDDLIADEAARAFPATAALARVVLVEATPRLLGTFDAALADYASSHFRREGIAVLTSTAVRAIEVDGVVLASGERIGSDCVVWAGGTSPVALTGKVGGALDDRGRLLVDEHLRVADRPGFYAIGDCAAVGKPGLPATAQVAQQQGTYLARALERQRRGRPVPPFRFRSFGMLAYIGAGRALADLPHVKWGGRGAWIFWRSVYLTKLVSLANKVKVAFDWIKATAFGRDLTRF